MIDILKSLVPVLSVCIGALLGYFAATRMERHKESRIRYAIATVLQAELIRLHRKLKDHNALLSAYVARFSKEVNEREALKYVPLTNPLILDRLEIAWIGESARGRFTNQPGGGSCAGRSSGWDWFMSL